MKLIRWMKELMAHLCIICSLALVVVHILDWYNPFMDFAGHTTFLVDILIICSFFLGVSDAFRTQENGGKRK